MLKHLAMMSPFKRGMPKGDEKVKHAEPWQLLGAARDRGGGVRDRTPSRWRLYLDRKQEEASPLNVAVFLPR